MKFPATQHDVVEGFYNLLERDESRLIVKQVHVFLRFIGWQEALPEPQTIFFSIIIIFFTLFSYYVILGRKHKITRQSLAMELERALEHVMEMQEKLEALEVQESHAAVPRKGSFDKSGNADVNNNNSNREIRIWMDGAFDMMHYGHMNAFRQGRSLGTYLVVGVNTDASITECKGTPPIMNDEERLAAVKACRWVDEVVENCPYIMSPEYLNYVIEKYKIDYVVHGDDPCIVDGKDVYQDAKDRGYYKSIPRTEGVSTTDIVGRMLYISRDHHERIRKSPMNGSLLSKTQKKLGAGTDAELSVADTEVSISSSGSFVRRSKFLTTSRMLRIFSSNCREPKPDDKIIYVDGAFDMFHVGHVRLLEAAKKMGNYLIVGVFNDDLVNSHRGQNYPIMNLNERVLSVLGCKYVDDVLIDAPWELSREMIASLRISSVVAGSYGDGDETEGVDRVNYYSLPKQLNIFKEVTSTSNVTVQEIVNRVLDKEGLYKNKVKKKMAAENEYYTNRYGFDVAGKPITNGIETSSSSSSSSGVLPPPALKLP